MVGVALGGSKQSGKANVDLVQHFDSNSLPTLGFHTEFPGLSSQQGECLNSHLSLMVVHQMKVVLVWHVTTYCLLSTWCAHWVQYWPETPVRKVIVNHHLDHTLKRYTV